MKTTWHPLTGAGSFLTLKQTADKDQRISKTEFSQGPVRFTGT